MSKYTKIVATISDARCDVDFIKQLYESGMNVVRMNSAHLQEEGFQKIIDNVRAVSNKIAILMDTKGPEVRTTALSGDSNILFSTGDIVRITGKEGTLTGNGYIGVSYPRFAEDLSIGSHILIDDGELEFVVRKKENDDLLCESLNNGELGARKSVNVPGVRITYRPSQKKTFAISAMPLNKISTSSLTRSYAANKMFSIYRLYSTSTKAPSRLSPR